MIQGRVLHAEEFRFNPPRIIARHKSGKEYRALCLLTLPDRVIDRIAARYLRGKFDQLLSSSAWAYCLPTAGKPFPQHHQAVEGIRNFLSAHHHESLWGAECDLKKFFDCIDHRIAQAAFRAACSSVFELGDIVNQRACQIFRAHLQCYDFQADVEGRAAMLLRNHGSGASFCWPAGELRAFHSEAFPNLRIGVPQGTAISGVTANLVLSLADFAVEDAAADLEGQVKYWRFCDDMLQLAETKENCSTIFDAYLAAVRSLRLPIHPWPKNFEE